jgi:hypothetical protein
MVNRRGAPQNMRPAQKGEVRNPRGRPPGQRPHAVVLWDLKQQMRELCPKARDVVARCLDSEDERVALLAAQIAFERGYGKPEVHADVSLTCHFAEVPQTMELGEWLANKGQPTPNGWLEHQKRTQEAERTSGLPTSATGSSGGHPGEVLDLEPEPEPTTVVVEEATMPLPPEIDPKKLN